MKQRILGYVCVLGGLLIFAGVLALYASLWGLVIMAAGGLLMAPIWWPALISRMDTGHTPFQSAFWYWARKGRNRP